MKERSLCFIVTENDDASKPFHRPTKKAAPFKEKALNKTILCRKKIFVISEKHSFYPFIKRTKRS